MKKITLSFLFILATIFGFSQNLISNGTFDSATGWTVINHYEAANTFGSVDIAGGVATFSETEAGPWKHMGIYTSLYLDAGTYQFDMDMTYADISDLWGEVYIGANEPVQNADYSGDQQVLVAYNAWACAATTYSGSAIASGCDTTSPGEFTIVTAGTYYLLFRSGGATYGTTGIVIDNVTLVSTTPSPVAGFTVSTSTANLDAVFTNTSTDATSYSWDFGDGAGSSTNTDPTYIYASAGVYAVTLTATSSAGSDEYTKVITVGEPANLISNGTFDSATGWTVINHYEAANTFGSVDIAGGVATFSETEAGPWKHMGIYTSVYLEPGIYQFDMHMSYAGISDVWGEVYIGATEPVQNADYSGDQQVIKAYNAWDCSDITTYDGFATESGCDSNSLPGQFEITSAGTYYLLFRTGGATYGSTGIVIDNITLYSTAVLSVKDFVIEGLSVYPNPTTNVWNINTKDQAINSIELFSITGKSVLKFEPNSLSAQVDASGLSNGIYFALISTELGTASRKLIKN